MTVVPIPPKKRMPFSCFVWRENRNPNKFYGPPSPGDMSERDWLCFLWLYHCWSRAAAKDFLHQATHRACDVDQWADYTKHLPTPVCDRITAEIARRIMENDRILDLSVVRPGPRK